ncbi:unnamed protein product [Chondrus crispus]|uniref:Uncharacterized protein n=1 Tax=Chondrus crispus TaxID=2769 RepID=R7QCS7_CHOCR|nr:unnamed protein product [Chondrus crispus]CDF36312.1 unnamed protein product [Chondrus crispus]|eukprot:XP_005716131.1 unnamed protein product [Chondrus crispus]
MSRPAATRRSDEAGSPGCRRRAEACRSAAVDTGGSTAVPDDSVERKRLRGAIAHGGMSKKAS